MSACPVCANPEATESRPGEVMCPACGLLVQRRCCASWMPLQRCQKAQHQPTCRVLRPSPAALLSLALSVAVPGLLKPSEALPLAIEEGIARYTPGEVLAVAVTAAGQVCHAAELLEGSGRDEAAPGWIEIWQEARALALPAVEQLRAAQHRRDHAGRAEA